MSGKALQLRNIVSWLLLLQPRFAKSHTRHPCLLQCEREESNLHVLNGHQVLSLARLPIPPRSPQVSQTPDSTFEIGSDRTLRPEPL
jgi:hypothetical protein